MIVSEIFPEIFSRYTPVLDGQARVLEAAKILTSPQVSAVIVSGRRQSAQSGTRYAAAGGYHILSGLRMRSTDLNLLYLPCSLIAKPIKVVNEKESLGFIVKAIARSRLGVVLVKRKLISSEILTTVELRDFIRLYRSGRRLQEIDVKVGSLASSPVLAVRGEDTLKHVIGVMLKHRKRKVLLRDTGSLISDRDVLNFLIGSHRYERLRDEPDKIFNTQALELPSSRPPFVESDMGITEAAGMMNPDAGDSLICDRGLISFWDLVIKLENLTEKSSVLYQGYPLNDQVKGGRIQRNSSTRVIADATEHISPAREKLLTAIVNILKKQGFIDSHNVPQFARERIVDPLYFENPARAFYLWGVNAGQKGGRKYTSFDLFGSRMLHESYYVTNWDEFSKYLSAKLEDMFRSKNPDPPRQMKLAFTRFMHDFGLHWTGCIHFHEVDER